METSHTTKKNSTDFYKQKRSLSSSPLTTAGFFSRLSFWWMKDLLRKGMKRALTLDDVYKLPTEQESAFLANLLETQWEKEVAREGIRKNHDSGKCSEKEHEKERPSLTRAIVKTFWKQYLYFTSLLTFSDTVLKIIQPLALGALVRYFNHREDYSEESGFYLSRYWGFLMGSLIIAPSVLSCIIYQPAFFGSHSIGLQIETACSALIFRKALRLSQFSLQKTDLGHIVNLLATDVIRMEHAVSWLQFLAIGPIQVLLSSIVLYVYVGPSCLIGVLFLTSFGPLQVWIGRKFLSHRKKTAVKSDKRIRLMNEIICGIKLIKMNAWELSFSKRVEEARFEEMKYIQQSFNLRTINFTLTYIMSKLIVFLTLIVFVLVYEQPLTTEIVFIALTVYNKMHVSIIQLFPKAIELLAENRVAMSRIQNFLLLDEKPKRKTKLKEMERKHNAVVSLIDATAKWQTDKSKGNAIQNINLNVWNRELIFILGQVGSGKSSLLHAILKELPLAEGHIKTWNIQPSIGYAAQDSWLFDGSLKENILFGSVFEPQWYDEVIYACALVEDIRSLPYGDNTLVGDCGIKLSGGQKARVGLARAVYSRADLLLLDDPFSSVDVTTAKFLFKNCVQGILKKKSRILVVHQTQFLKNADKILVLKDGAVEALGNGNSVETELRQKLELVNHSESLLIQSQNLIVSNQIQNDDDLSTLKWEHEQMEKSTLNLIPNSLESIDLFYEEDKLDDLKENKFPPATESEEIQTLNELPFDLYIKYFRTGSNYCLIIILGLLFLISQGFYFGVDVWMTLWTRSEEVFHASSTNASHTNKSQEAIGNVNGGVAQLMTYMTIHNDRQFDLWIYFSLILLMVFTAFCKTWLFFYCTRRSSLILHHNLFDRILRAPISFFQQNSAGRILNRFSKDVGSIDSSLPTHLLQPLDGIVNVFGTVVLVCVFNPFLLIPISALAFLFQIHWKVYIRTSQSLKRLEGITKSPVLSHLANSVRGITTIRAFGQEENWIRKFDEYQDVHMATNFYLLATNRWFVIGLEWLSITFGFCVTFGFLTIAESSGGFAGLSISTALTLAWTLISISRHLAEIQTQMVAVERVLEYSNIKTESEFKSSPDKKPSTNWPKKGKIQFKNVSLFYDQGSPAVLHNLSFEIHPAEKIGVVGKTGVGKSSLISLLFRLTEPTGQIFIDQVLVNTPGFGLGDLRSKISIIAQDPILFTGTIRYNLDPFENHTDDQLWSVLEKVQMRQCFTSLEYQILDGGGNLSFGERQLVCIARALLRQNRILIMDESTANLDLKTDTLIHKMVDTQFSDCTVLCVAHRLHSVINCDRIMVLRDGRILEFDKPLKLLQDESSAFRHLVRETGKDMEKELLKLAEISRVS